MKIGINNSQNYYPLHPPVHPLHVNLINFFILKPVNADVNLAGGHNRVLCVKVTQCVLPIFTQGDFFLIKKTILNLFIPFIK